MGKLVALFLLSDGMGKFLEDYSNIIINNCHMVTLYYYMLFKLK